MKVAEIVVSRVQKAWALPSGGVELRGPSGSVRVDACIVAAGA